MKTQGDGSEEKPLIPTAGEIFPDGVALELIRDQSDPKHLRVLAWQGKILEEGLRLSHHGRLYEALHVEPSVASAMCVPSSVAPPETTRTLFDALQGLLTSSLAQSEPTITLLTAGAFATWFPEVLPMAPLVYVVAPTESLKIALLQILRLVCRRTLPLVGINRGTFRSLPMELQPTLLLDEPDLCPAMLKLLQSSCYRGAFIPSGRGLVNPFGPKIIFSRAFPRSLSPTSPVLRIVLIPPAGPIAPLDEESEARIATEFQSRFVGFRLRSFKHVRVPEFDVSKLTPALQELARSLGAALVGDKELQGKILASLSPEDEKIRAERSSTVEVLVIETLLFYCHKDGISQIRSFELARTVSALYAGRGSDAMISAESAGWTMKRLGLPTSTIDSAGNGLKLADSTRRAVHELALAYEVFDRPGAFRAGCQHCDEVKKILGR